MDDTDHNANLEPLRQKYECGDSTALIDTLRYCLTFTVPVPEWAAAPVRDGLTGWRFDRYKTLDQALGVQRPKNYDNTRGLSKNRYLWEIYDEVRAAHEAGVPLDETFDKVSEKYGTSASTVKRMYYEAKKLIETFSRD